MKISLRKATLFLAFFGCSMLAHAYDVQQDGINYNFVNDKTELQVTSSSSCSGDVVIPDEITIEGKTYKVTGIEGGAFRNCSPLMSIIIGNNVKTIGEDAFNSCKNLKSAVIPNGVIEIKDRAFRDCEKLESINIPTGISYIGDRCFESNLVLDNVVIPGNVKTVRAFAFHCCRGMKHLTLSEGLEVIQNSSFEECNSLEELNFPKSIKDIQSTAFATCNTLKRVEVPVGIEIINYAVFCNCHSLEEVILPNTVKSLDLRSFERAKVLQKIIIPESVTSISNGSFTDCNELKTVICMATVPPSSSYGSFSVHDTLYVQKGYKSVYEADANWSRFSPIIELNSEPGIDNPIEDMNLEYVDLGLPSGKLWAKCNIGASVEEEYGTYFDWENNPVQERWDAVWRTPTKEERDELVTYCTYSLDVVNGVNGARYTGNNGKSIFLPFAGYLQWGYGPMREGVGGQYWTCTPYVDGSHWILAANENPQKDDNAYYWPLPYFSLPVRAIRDKADEDPVKDVEGCVDLGLSSGTLWASCNLGADEPEQYGGYYAWGEIEEKDIYTSSTYLYENVDLGKSICATQYDVAYVNTIGKLRMPTSDEAEELINSCNWTRVELNNVIGYKVVGPNGNSIFIPCAGGKGYTGDNYIGSRGYYWTGTGIDLNHAVRFDLNPSDIYLYDGLRSDGRPIRPVYCSDSDNSIISVKDNITIQSIIRLDGTMTNDLHHGINIIRNNDGSCKKVIILK